MASGNDFNASNNSNGQLPVSLYGIGQPNIVNTDTFALNELRFAEAEVRLAAMKSQNRAGYSNYLALKNELLKKAEEGRKASLAIRALESGSLNAADLLKSTEYSRKALQYPDSGENSSALNNTYTETYIATPANATVGQSFVNAQGQTSTSTNASQATPNFDQNHPSGSHVQLGNFGGNTFAQQFPNQFTNFQSSDRVVADRAQVLAYFQSKQHGAVAPSNSSNGQHAFHFQQQVNQMQNSNRSSTAQSAFQLASTNQYLRQVQSVPQLSTGSSFARSTQEDSDSRMNNVFRPPDAEKPPDTMRAQFTPPLSSATSYPSASYPLTMGNANTYGSSLTYTDSGSSSSLAGALGDTMFPPVKGDNHVNHRPIANRVQTSAREFSRPAPAESAPTNAQRPAQASVQTRPPHRGPANDQNISAQAASAIARTLLVRGVPLNQQKRPAQGMLQDDQKRSAQNPCLNERKPGQNASSKAPQDRLAQSSSSDGASSLSFSTASHASPTTKAASMDTLPVASSNPTTPVSFMTALAQPVQISNSGPHMLSTSSAERVPPLAAALNDVYYNNVPQIPHAAMVPYSGNSSAMVSYHNSNVTGIQIGNVNGHPSASRHAPYNYYRQQSTGQSEQVVEQSTAVPATPSAKMIMSTAPVTPDTKRLAKDILRALGASSTKRKASKPPSATSDDDGLEPAAKRQTIKILPEAFLEPAADGMEVQNAVASVGLDAAAMPSPVAILAKDTLPPASDTSDATGALSIPDMLRPQSATDAYVSSTGDLDVDTALQPFEDSSSPLFLPSPDPTPDLPLQIGVQRMSRRMDGHASTSASASVSASTPARYSKYIPGPTPGLRVIVEVPSLSASLRQRYMRQVLGKGKQKALDATSSSFKGIADIENLRLKDKLEESANTTVVDGEHQRQARKTAEIAASRLRRRPCLWHDCPHVSNCANNLKKHVEDHVDSHSTEQKYSFPCWWGDCVRRFKESLALLHHLQNHVRKSILCAYQGCEEVFEHPLELRAHVEDRHPRGSELRPDTTPFQHVSMRRLPTLRTMFSYYDGHLPVQMQRMTKERRAKVGPWVMKNMYGVVNFSATKYKARAMLRGVRRGDNDNMENTESRRDWPDKYDFLEPWDATYPSNCGDLESTRATAAIEGGLVLVPDIDGSQGSLEEQYFTSLANRISENDAEKYVVKEDRDSEGPVYEMVKKEDADVDVFRALSPDRLPEGPIVCI